jgi:hypothetical protein
MKQPSGNAGEGPAPGPPGPGGPLGVWTGLPALRRLIAARGLRRGEGCGLRRPDTDLAARAIAVRWQITSSAGSSCP